MQFEDFQHKLQVVLGMKKEGIYSLSDRDHKLRLSDALFCAEDIVRNRKFFVAIQKALQNLGDEVVVIDAGAGTGVLGIMTLIHGAKHCTFIEENPYTMELCKQVVESFGYTHRSDFLLGDATNINLKGEYNLLVSETIRSDFQSEDFHHIISHLKPYLREDAIIIPERFEMMLTETKTGKSYTQYLSSYKGISGLDLQDLSGEVEVQGRVYLYDDVCIDSGDCVSFFNAARLYVES